MLELASAVRFEAAGFECRTAVLVLGMHRSGTSALTRVLSFLGVTLPSNIMGASPSNEAGHWESRPLVDLHNAMLREAGSSWDDWRKLDLAAQLPSGRLACYKAEIRRLIEEEYGEAQLLVLKDPRICRFVPLYREVLCEMGISIRPILAFRDPRAVSASLQARNHIDAARAQAIWLRHVLDAETATRDLPRAVVFYDSLLDDWHSALAPVTKELRAEWPRTLADAGPAIDAFLSRDHQHYVAPEEPVSNDHGLSPLVKNAFSAALKLGSQRDEAIAEFQALSTTFDVSASLFDNAWSARQDQSDAALASALAERKSARREADKLRGEIKALRAAQNEALAVQEATASQVAETDQRTSINRLLLCFARAGLQRTRAAVSALRAIVWFGGGVIPTIRKALAVLLSEGAEGVRWRMRYAVSRSHHPNRDTAV